MTSQGSSPSSFASSRRSPQYKRLRAIFIFSLVSPLLHGCGNDEVLGPYLFVDGEFGGVLTFQEVFDSLQIEDVVPVRYFFNDGTRLFLRSCGTNFSPFSFGGGDVSVVFGVSVFSGVSDACGDVTADLDVWVEPLEIERSRVAAVVFGSVSDNHVIMSSAVLVFFLSDDGIREAACVGVAISEEVGEVVVLESVWDLRVGQEEVASVEARGRHYKRGRG